MTLKNHLILLALLFTVTGCKAGSSQSHNWDFDHGDCSYINRSLARHDYLIQLQKCAALIERQFAQKWQSLPQEFQDTILIFDTKIKNALLKAEALDLGKLNSKDLMIEGSLGVVEKLGKDLEVLSNDQRSRRLARAMFSRIIGDFCRNYQSSFHKILVDYESLVRGSDGNQVQVLLTSRTQSILANAKLCSIYSERLISDDEMINAYYLEHPQGHLQKEIYSKLFANDNPLPYDEIVLLIANYLKVIEGFEGYNPRKRELLAIKALGDESINQCSVERQIARNRAMAYYKDFVNIHRFLKNNNCNKQTSRPGSTELNQGSREISNSDKIMSSSIPVMADPNEELAFNCRDLKHLWDEFEQANILADRSFDPTSINTALRDCATSLETRFTDKWSSLDQSLQTLATEFDFAVQHAEAKAEVLQLGPLTDLQRLVAGSVALVEKHGKDIGRRWADSDADWSETILREVNRVVGGFCNEYPSSIGNELNEDYRLLITTERQTLTRGYLKPVMMGGLGTARLCILLSEKQVLVEVILEGYLFEHPDLDSINGLYQHHTLLFSRTLLVSQTADVIQLIEIYLDSLNQDQRFESRSIELREILRAREILEEKCGLYQMLRRKQMLWLYRDKANIFNFLRICLNEQNLLCKQLENRQMKGKAVIADVRPAQELEQKIAKLIASLEQNTAITKQSQDQFENAESKVVELRQPFQLKATDPSQLKEKIQQKSIAGSSSLDVEKTDGRKILANKESYDKLHAIEKAFTDTMQSFSFKTRNNLYELKEEIFSDRSSLDSIDEDNLHERIARFLAKRVKLLGRRNWPKQLKGQIKCRLKNSYVGTIRTYARPYVDQILRHLHQNRHIDPRKDLKKLTTDWMAAVRILDAIACMSDSEMMQIYNHFMRIRDSSTTSIGVDESHCNK